MEYSIKYAFYVNRSVGEALIFFKLATSQYGGHFYILCTICQLQHPLDPEQEDCVCLCINNKE